MKIKWRPFFDSSGWAIKEIHDCRIVGIGPQRMLYEFPAEPDESAYLWVTMSMAQPEVEEGPWDNVSWIIIDVANDKWSYVQRGKIVNWPPRYRYTQEHRDQIYKAAGSFVDALLNEDKNEQLAR